MQAALAVAPAPAPSRDGWIVSPTVDLFVFIFSACITLIPWLLADRFGVRPFYLLAAVALVSNGPHLASTWTRVYLDGRERFRRPVHYWLIPGLLAAVVAAFLLVDGHDSAWLRTILFYWACWHFAAQCWGLLRIYQRKHGVADTRLALLEKVLLFSGAGWCVLRRIYTGPWRLFGVPIWHPEPRAWMVNAVGAVVCLMAALYAAIWLRARLRGDRADGRRPLFIAACIGAFAVPFTLIHDGTAAFAAAAAWHGVQYIGIVWFYNRNRYQGGVDESARAVSWVSQPGRGAAYFALLVALDGVAYVGLLAATRLSTGTSWDFNTWSLAVWTSLTFGHYYLDGVIWKLRRDAELTRRLQAA